MVCKNCGKEIENGAKFCPYCGKEVTETTKTNDSQASNSAEDKNVYEHTANQSGSNNFSGPVKEEKANVGFAILSFFIPLAGLIIFLVKKDNEPKTAKVSGICALVSFVLGIILSVVMFFWIFSFSKETIDYGKNIIEEIIDYGNEKQDEIKREDGSFKNDDATQSWTEYEFVVNGKNLKLPCSYDELKDATGFTMKPADESSVLSDNYYTIVNLYNNDRLALYTEILNDTGSDAKYSQLKVTRISQSNYQVSNGAFVITFPGNLKVGEQISEDKIIELFGEPNDVYEYSNDGYESKTYTYNSNTLWTTTNYYKIKVVNGVIDEITLDNRNYK